MEEREHLVHHTNQSESAVASSANIRQVSLLTFVVPPLLLALLEVVRLVAIDAEIGNRVLYTLVVITMLIGSIAFAWAISRWTNRLQGHLVHQNQELLALHHANLTISRELHLNTVLQQVVSEASALIGARYGAISYGRHLPRLDAFVTHGVSEDVRAAIGDLPVGRGVLAIPIASGESLKLDSISDDPHSVGFPPNHPPMTTLLAMPIITRTGVFGNLYLSDKLDGRPFDDEDSSTLKRLASAAAVAVDNAQLHEQVQVLAITTERERIAREMHDSLAQVLAWVNTQSQAVMVHLNRGHTEEARKQLEHLAASAREAYIDVREGILALRGTNSGATSDILESIRHYVQSWQDTHGIPVIVTIEPSLRGSDITPLIELHLLRLIQESLTNVRKHARATSVTITMSRRDRFWVISIVDNGTGFAPESTPRGSVPQFGLSIMRERAEASGGTFDLQSLPGVGTTITVTIPTRSS